MISALVAQAQRRGGEDRPENVSRKAAEVLAERQHQMGQLLLVVQGGIVAEDSSESG